YIINRHPGYDIDRLVRMEIGMKPTDTEYDREERYADINRILARVRSNPQVESATLAFNECYENMSLNANSIPSDSIIGAYVDVKFIPGTDFFRTFGLRTSGGPEDGKVFNEPPCNKNDIVVGRSMAKMLHPGVNALGHYLNEHSEKMPHDKDRRIVGIVNDALFRSSLGRTPIVYKALMPKDVLKRMGNIGSLSIVARMKPGVDPDDFVRQNARTISTDFSAGNLYAHSPITYVTHRAINTSGERNNNIILMALVLFLIVNLCLGVIGTFYLQTADRSRDAGIMRAFGATRASVCRNMIAEGWLMAVFSWMIGCTGVWFLVRKNGMTEPDKLFDILDQGVMDALPLWFDNFALHFWVISAIVLALLLVTVTVGIYIPARRIASISPVDALRENN
ncbi:MAG: ABC transporter permease, partial [Duncaniella sp.]|nr:ABC transporter permease [Duncaniella sp.]